ncbi:MAG: capsid cement protein [Pseudomonadota bacterium]
MAIEIPGLKAGAWVANATLAANQFYAVKMGSNGKWAVASAGQRTIGVAQNTPAADEPVDVMMSGFTKAYAGGTITCGDAIAVNSSGQFVSAGDNDYQVGVAFESAVSGEYFTLYLSGGQGLTESTSPA